MAENDDDTGALLAAEASVMEGDKGRGEGSPPSLGVLPEADMRAPLASNTARSTVARMACALPRHCDTAAHTA
jgi:hypothetical protein